MLKKVLSVLCLVPAMATAQSYVVYDFTHDRVLESSSPNHVQPIASVTKLMTANVFLENNRNANCTASITDDDYDYIKGTHTKLPKYTPISCNELLKAMLVHSDNYAAHALSRSAGMSRLQFIQKMNEKARELGMRSTRFSDSSGLSDSNISSVMDLVKLAKYSLNKAQIKNLSNMPSAFIQAGGRSVFVKNTNKLVREEVFDAAIGVISLNNHSSAFRTNFTKGKLEQYGCIAGRSMHNFTVDEAQYEEGYDEAGMDRLIQQVGG